MSVRKPTSTVRTSSGPDAGDRFDRPRPADVQPRFEIGRRLAEPLHDADLVGLDCREAGREPRDERDRGERRADRLPAVGEVVQQFVEREAAEPAVDGLRRAAHAGERAGRRGALEREQPHRVQQHQERTELVVDDADERGLLVRVGRRREQRPEPAGEDHADEVDPEPEHDDVLADDADGFARQPHEQRQRLERFAHQHDVAGLGGDVGARADGDADAGPREGRGVVDAVADEGDVRRVHGVQSADDHSAFCAGSNSA